MVRASTRRLAEALGIKRAIGIYESTLACVPAVFGAIRPAIVLPVSAVTGLPAAHVEAILAHELAHIARHDFLVNCIQAVVEVVLFYHPAVWWLSRRIRQEREMYCDQIAAALCGDRVMYSRALLALEEGREEFALAATGGDLKSRIERLLHPSDPRRRNSEQTAFVPALLIMLVLLMGAATVAMRA
jgi:beta-lactamase regulating signal transducer with metallopeptidase domain